MKTRTSPSKAKPGILPAPRLAKLVLFFLCSLCYFPSSATIFTVTNLTDGSPGSLRSQINAANASPGNDTIQFAVAGAINLFAPMTAITGPVFIDGTSAPGYVACGQPQIALDGSSAGAANGIQLLSGASGSTIAALNVRNFNLNGIQFIDSDDNRIQGCFIGTTQDGNSAASNGQNGIQMELGSDFNLIGGPAACNGNVLSGNNGQGIALNGCNFNTVSGNLIGLNATGTAAVGNNSIGLFLVNGSNSNVIGGSALLERNVIANNGNGLAGNGVDINGCSNNTFLNNHIGVNPTGTVAMGNAENGMALFNAPNTTIRNNVISNHNFHAIVLNGGSNNIDIFGNVIGTNAAGTVAMGNDDSGVIVINSSTVNIGGTNPGEGNLLSGSISEYGVFVIGSSNVNILGNRIGTDATGTLPIPNFDGGIRIDFNSDNNIVGGTAAGAGNTIAFNTGYGVGVLSNDCNQNLISRNSFFCNTGEGIDLNNAGNNNYASPVITSFAAGGATGMAGAGDIVELYYDSTCTATCQGKDFIASVTANAVGAWSYVGPLNTSGTLAVLAISTTPPVNNTSEFTCQIVLPVEWLSFEAAPDGQGNVMLDWETASEVDVSHFEVERSVNGLDFESIGEVQGAHPGAGGAYGFVDESPALGFNAYRIREVDLNGGNSFSEVRELWLDKETALFDLAGNPVDAQVRFRMNVTDYEQVSYTLFDQTGKIIFNGEKRVMQGEWVEFSSTGLAAGLYNLRVRAGERQLNRKVLVQHVD